MFLSAFYKGTTPAVPEEEKKDAETSEGEEAAVEAKEVTELEDKIEESKDASEDADK